MTYRSLHRLNRGAMSTDPISDIPQGRIASGEAVTYAHRGPQGSRLIHGTVTGYYRGSGRYRVEGADSRERCPLASVLERDNSFAARVP